MAFILRDRVKETSTTTGTGTYTLAGAPSGYQSFSGAGYANGDTCFYFAFEQAGSSWEVGLGTWGTGGTLARTTILSSSNSGSAVSWSAGTRTIAVGLPAEAASPMYDSVTELALSTSVTSPYLTGGYDGYYQTGSLPAMTAGNRYLAVMDLETSGSPQSMGLMLGNTSSDTGFQLHLNGGFSALGFGQRVTGTYTSLISALSIGSIVFGRCRITLEWAISSSTISTVTMGYNGWKVSQTLTVGPDLTTGTWQLGMFNALVSPPFDSDMKSLRLYVNPRWT